MTNKIIFAMLCVASLSACNSKKENAAENKSAETAKEDSVVTEVQLTNAQVKSAGIKLGYLGNEKLSEVIKANGYIEVPPQNHAQVSTYIGGIVKSVNVQEGNLVKKGQTVIVLEHPDFIKLQQEYIAGKNNLRFLEQEFLRQKELAEKNAGTGKIFQEAESKYYVEKGNVASLENQLSMLSISIENLDKGQIAKTVELKSPINGYIGHLNISLGAFAEPNKALFDVTDNSHLIVRLDIFEKDISKLQIGQKINITLPNQDEQNNQEIEGVIYLIGKSVDNETKTITVRANIKNEKGNLIPGMFVNVNIAVADNNFKTIPDDAVVRVGKKQYIFMATDAWCVNPNSNNGIAKQSTPKTEMSKDSISLSYKMIEVQTGASANGYVGIDPFEEILSSNIVVVKGAYYLISQLKSGETVGCCAPAEGEKKEE